ncbi:MAG: hypothetical protein KI786_15915 [Mameliella sp.]|nr:hypothetical protein [Phaeodactylibacter sp.]
MTDSHQTSGDSSSSSMKSKQRILYIIGAVVSLTAFVLDIWLFNSLGKIPAFIILAVSVVLITLWLRAQLKVAKLAALNSKVYNQNWVKTHLTQLFDETKGLDNIQVLSDKIITTLSTQLGAGIGAFYINDSLFTNEDEESMVLKASYAFTDRKPRKQDLIWVKALWDKWL